MTAMTKTRVLVRAVSGWTAIGLFSAGHLLHSALVYWMALMLFGAVWAWTALVLFQRS
jgi:hypothetical protein